MAEVYVDSVRESIAPAAGTLADLLEILDARTTATRHLVTDVRLDGVEEPAFRDPSVAGRSLAAIGRVDVVTGSPDALRRQCCQDAADAASDISARVLHLAALFRGGDAQAGNAGLTDLAECLGTFVVFVHSIAQSPGFGGARDEAGGEDPQAPLADLDAWLAALVDAQGVRDWLTVADVLEYDLAPALRRGEQALRALAS